jgi:uncharacterized protein YukE
MKSCDLGAGTAKLELAAKSLTQAVRDVAETWDDENSRRFQETYIAPLEPRLKTLLDAVGRLAEVLSAAEHQCSDHDHG